MKARRFFDCFTRVRCRAFSGTCFPAGNVSTQTSCSLCASGFAGCSSRTPFSTVGNCYRKIVPIAHEFSVLPTVCKHFLVKGSVPCSGLGTVKKSIRKHFLRRRLPFIKVGGIRLAGGTLLVKDVGFHRQVKDIRCLALANGCTLDTDGLECLLRRSAVFNYNVNCNLSDVFNPLRTSLGCTGQTGGIDVCIGLKFGF